MIFFIKRVHFIIALHMKLNTTYKSIIISIAPFFLIASLSFGTNTYALPDSMDYQAKLNNNSLENLNLIRELNPEGKTIETILFASHDAITQDDPWPLALSNLHQITQSKTVEQELLFHIGDPWSQNLILESERNLRNYLFVSIANIIACKGSNPDHVIVLVITKDLWSLRVNTDFSFVGSSLNFLELQLEEANLLGKNKKAKTIFYTNPMTISLSEQYSDPRILASRISASEEIGIIQNKKTGATEGGIALLSFGQPLFSLRSKWGWNILFSAQKDIYRLLSSGETQKYRVSATQEEIPISYHRRLINGQATLTHSYGTHLKQNFSTGWRAKIADYSLTSEHLSYQPRTIDEFQSNYLPLSESYGSLFLRYQLFLADFTRLIDIHTFALTEDFQLGPTLTIEAALAQPTLGWSSSFFEPSMNASYSILSGDNLFTAQLNTSARYQRNRISDHNWLERTLVISVKNISPRFGGFRLHSAARLVRQSNDLNRNLETLGGESYLRGYPAHFLSGSQTWSGNLELRTLPLLFRTFHMGGVAFLDMGDVFDATEQIKAHASIGLGARILFPQFNRQVLRVDLGFPLEKLSTASASYLVVQFGQAF